MTGVANAVVQSHRASPTNLGRISMQTSVPWASRIRAYPANEVTMESEIGRYFEGRLLDTQRVLRALYDLGLGQGSDTQVWIDGRELVFGKGEVGQGRGYMRLIPAEAVVTIAFPKGYALLDPQRRTHGAPGSQTVLVVGHASDLDPYVRRLVAAAYALE